MKLATKRILFGALATVAVGLGSTDDAVGVVIFSQTPTIVQGTGSDVSLPPSGKRLADVFSLGAAATARSVTWRGMYAQSNTPTFPTDFTLTIFDDSAGLPGSVLSNTSVSVTPIDTGDDLGDFDVYEFQADLTPTLLLAGTNYWFSPLADTTVDADDFWFWARAASGGSAHQSDVTGNGSWVIENGRGPSYFILDDQALATVPEPATATLALLGLGGLMLRRRRMA